MGTVEDDSFLVDLLDEYWSIFNRLIKQIPNNLPEDYVHDLRVAARRLAALLQLLVVVAFNNPGPEYLLTLRRVIKFLGSLRDLDVQIDYTFTLLADHPELKDFYAVLVAQHQQSVSHVEGKIKEIKLDNLKKMHWRLKKRLQVIIKDPVTREQIIADLKANIDQALVDVLMAGDKIDPIDAKTIHHTRLAIKKYRYSVEVMKPLLNITGQEMQSMQAYQTKLGEIQDLEVLIKSLKRHMAQSSNADSDSLLSVKQFLEDNKSILVHKLTRLDPYKFLTR